jgi:HEAT repeat protein
MESIRDPETHVRRAAVYALGNTDNVHSLAPSLAELAGRPESDVRRAAAEILLLAGSNQSIGTLIALATDNDAVIRQTAVAALGELGDRRALPVLRDRLLHDAASPVRAEAAYRLRLTGDESALADLEFAAKHDASSAVRRWARLSVDELRKAPGSDLRLRPVQSGVPAPSHRSP